MKTWLLTCVLLWPAAAMAENAAPAACMPAVQPAPYYPAAYPTKPALPDCIDAETRVSNCPQKVLDAYNDDVEAYNRALGKLQDEGNAYVGRLKAYVAAANAYSACEVERMNALFSAGAS